MNVLKLCLCLLGICFFFFSEETRATTETASAPSLPIKPQTIISSNKVMVRIKDLVEIRGVRSNALTGLGLVVGLPGTGDSKASLITNKTASNLITRLGIQVAPNEVMTKNLAIVVITADLPPFARIGDRLNVRISSIGDASSLEGGTLLLTTLSGADNVVYAVAQGAISQGTSMAGSDGSGASQGQKTSAPKTISLTNGALVEKEFATNFMSNNKIELSLINEDFTTANRISHELNQYFGEFIANPVNAGLIVVKMPNTVSSNNPSFNPVAFMSILEQLKVSPDTRAIVVINERTGTIVSGQDVVIDSVAISHGQLDILIGKQKKKVASLPDTVTVEDLVNALNYLGAGPRDIVSILQSLSAANALKAQMKIL